MRGVINMCTEYEGPKSKYEYLQMTQIRLPTVDHFEVDVDHLEAAVAFIGEYKKRGEKVYVHCKAGHGRAASVVLCWMISQNSEETPKKLNLQLAKLRKVRPSLYRQKNVIEYLHRLSQKLVKSTKDEQEGDIKK